LDIFFLLLPWLKVRQFITDRTTLTGRLPFFAPVNHRLMAFQSRGLELIVYAVPGSSNNTYCDEVARKKFFAADFRYATLKMRAGFDRRATFARASAFSRNTRHWTIQTNSTVRGL
jgi:hypothetical protein